MPLIPRYQFFQHRARSNNDVFQQMVRSNNDVFQFFQFSQAPILISRMENMFGGSISRLNVSSVGKEGPSNLPRPLFLTSVILQ